MPPMRTAESLALRQMGRACGIPRWATIAGANKAIDKEDRGSQFIESRTRGKCLVVRSEAFPLSSPWKCSFSDVDRIDSVNALPQKLSGTVVRVGRSVALCSPPGTAARDTISATMTALSGRVCAALLLVLATADAQYCSNCEFHASTPNRGCTGYCTNCGSCGLGRINNLDYCYCGDGQGQCNSACPNYVSPSSGGSSGTSSSSDPSSGGADYSSDTNEAEDGGMIIGIVAVVVIVVLGGGGVAAYCLCCKTKQATAVAQPQQQPMMMPQQPQMMMQQQQPPMMMQQQQQPMMMQQPMVVGA
jgi:hypothetical protein